MHGNEASPHTNFNIILILYYSISTIFYIVIFYTVLYIIIIIIVTEKPRLGGIKSLPRYACAQGIMGI